MSWANLLDWAGHILGGLAALIGLVLFVTLLGNLGKMFAWLGRIFWALTKWLTRLLRSPRQALLEGVERSMLFTFALFPFIWLYEKLWLRPRRKPLVHPQKQNRQDPEGIAASLCPAPLTELARLWEAGFDILPLFNLPGSQVFIMSFYLYPQLWETESPSILVEPAKLLDDRPRWRLALRSGKDALCVEIDEAEFLAWWRQTMFNEQSEMDLAGWLRVSELTIGYCETHRYPIWRFRHENNSTEDRQRWREGLIAELTAYHDAVLYARIYDWSAADVALWREEIVARYRPLHGPDRVWTTNEPRPGQTNWAANFDFWLQNSPPIRLIDLLQTESGTDGLVNRMHRKSMPPYRREELAQVAPARRVWATDSEHPVCLLLEAAPDGQNGATAKIRFPQAWTESPDWPNQGPFLILRDRYIVTNEDGLSGLIDREGRFTVPCRYTYLFENQGNGECFEAATTLERNNLGEILCDLIDGDGKRINPPGLKVLAGTLKRDGCVVITENEDKPLRLDWMDTTGTVRNGAAGLAPDELRWAAVGNISANRRPVRCPDSGLWGGLDETGAVAFPPTFREAFWFDDGLAKAGVEPGKVGLIGPDGAWRIPPVWAYIWPESRQCYVVKNERGEFGAINPSGEVIVPIQSPDELFQDVDRPTPLPRGYEDDPVEQVMRLWRQSTLRKRADAAKTQDSLASLEGVFDANVRTRDLIEAGLWFMPVRVLRDKTDGLLMPKAGETGRIFTEYPVSLSIFDLSMEAPVAGLESAPQAFVGVPWRNLSMA